jgi:hypothetical protein
MSARDPTGLSPREQAKKKKENALKAEDMTLEMAASFIQRAFRSRQARMKVHLLLKQMFEKVLDPTTGKYFYYNTKTGESQWTKPVNLGSEDVPLSARDPAGLSPREQRTETKKEPRVKAKDMDDTAAALLIQQLWRTREARVSMRNLIKSLFEKIWDPVQQAYFYFDSRTGESQWTKPANLGSEDLDVSEPTPDKVKLSPRVKAKDMDDTAAALLIQRLYRKRKAFQKLFAMLAQVTEIF